MNLNVQHYYGLKWKLLHTFTYLFKSLMFSAWDRVGSTVYLLHHTINLVLYFNSEGKRLEVRFFIWFGNCNKVLNVIIASTHILSSRKSWHNDKFKYIITSSNIGLQCRVFETFYEKYIYSFLLKIYCLYFQKCFEIRTLNLNIKDDIGIIIYKINLLLKFWGLTQ